MRRIKLDGVSCVQAEYRLLNFDFIFYLILIGLYYGLYVYLFNRPCAPRKNSPVQNTILAYRGDSRVMNSYLTNSNLNGSFERGYSTLNHTFFHFF